MSSSWFDAKQLTSLAKNALNEAQKTLDKALDIQEDGQQVGQQVSAGDAGRRGSKQAQDDDDASSVASSASVSSSASAAAAKAAAAMANSKVWGSFTGSFFDAKQVKEEPAAASTGIVVSTAHSAGRESMKPASAASSSSALLEEVGEEALRPAAEGAESQWANEGWQVDDVQLEPVVKEYPVDASVTSLDIKEEASVSSAEEPQASMEASMATMEASVATIETSVATKEELTDATEEPVASIGDKEDFLTSVGVSKGPEVSIEVKDEPVDNMDATLEELNSSMSSEMTVTAHAASIVDSSASMEGSRSENEDLATSLTMMEASIEEEEPESTEEPARTLMEDALVEQERRSETSSSKSYEVILAQAANSGHTSGDELDTNTTSSDIEVIASPTSLPARTRMRPNNGHHGHVRQHARTGSELSAAESEESGNGQHEALNRKVAELSEILEAREGKLMEMSRSNHELMEQNSDLTR